MARFPQETSAAVPSRPATGSLVPVTGVVTPSRAGGGAIVAAGTG